jgi:hypothetical protein
VPTSAASYAVTSMSRGGHLGSWLASLALALAGCGDDAVPHQRDGAPPAIDAAGAPGDGRPDARPGGPAPAMILLIGDGMGPGQIDAASRYRHGAPGQLYMETLPVHSQLRSSSPNGITDSAAAATVMATGVYTWNYTLAIDRDGQRLETLVERAHARGLSAGVVTTTEITHATPAGFTAHVDSRASTMAIADQQARESQPEIMLGGGARRSGPVARPARSGPTTTTACTTSSPPTATRSSPPRPSSASPTPPARASWWACSAPRT